MLLGVRGVGLAVSGYCGLVFVGIYFWCVLFWWEFVVDFILGSSPGRTVVTADDSHILYVLYSMSADSWMYFFVRVLVRCRLSVVGTCVGGLFFAVFFLVLVLFCYLVGFVCF